MKKAFRFDGFDVNGFHEILIVSGELGYEIQIREAVVRPNCLTILRFKGAETEEFGHFTCPKYRGHCNSSNTTEKA
ncbi:unnamed protein product [Prunus armeniaca]